jgi:hypothetical protein
LHSGVLGPADKRSTITPCGLYDLLIEKQWFDVQKTAYGNVRKDWSGQNCEIDYRYAILTITGHKTSLYSMGGLSASEEESQEGLEKTKQLEKQMEYFSKDLQDMTDSLLRMSRDKPA